MDVKRHDLGEKSMKTEEMFTVNRISDEQSLTRKDDFAIDMAIGHQLSLTED
jgi:hypothetical protein